MKNRNNVLVIGPWVSGHIQQWIGNDSSYNYTVVTCHKDKNKKPTMVHNLFFINRLISFSILPFALIYYYFLVKPKIIHVHYLSSYGLISSFLPGKKIISIWGSDFNKIANANIMSRFIYRFVLYRYNVINSPGEHITKQLLGFGIKKDKIITLQYGLDFNKLENYSTSPRKNKKYVIASIRNWDDVYQIKRLITNWSEISPQHTELWLFGKSNNKKTEKEIINLAAHNSSIKVLGFLPHDELYQKLSCANAFISIPKMDGTPLSVLECCYLKLIPIVSNLPFYDASIKVPQNCLLPVDFTSDELKDAIHTAIENDTNETIKIYNKSYVESHFHIFHNRKIMLDTYKKLLAEV
ncbi:MULTISPECIES: glycosyltransferase [Providencia]|uniref:glycosyltransferase n=1 Tax=Providencia TaxID=586 RepID=UPI0014953321|nr:MULTISPECIES: glycosyltransferase [Providencia]NPD43491.1 glycosyltransferase [Providencia stuartii]NPD96775.1 glycosyltransferase [Providencia stuartii]HEM8880144.1 glycosyltransferase [Providencia stuartii]